MINSFEESIELHKHIINEDPYSYMAWYNLGQAYSCVGQYEKALAAYEYSYLIEPGFELGYQDRGDLFFELGRYKEALECYNEWRSEEHTSELQSRGHLVCRLLLEKK